MKKNSRGITLIALVITIIVLLILAGATIATLTGENGILSRAAEAKEKIEEAKAKEEGILSSIEGYLNGKLDVYGCLLESSTINGGEASYNNPTIPAGFKPVNTETSTWGDGTNPPTEESINAGLVIEDKDGNQFVWVPVDGEKLQYERHVYATPSVDDTVTTSDTGNDFWVTQKYRMYSDWQDTGGNSESVKKYGGFYIARYEAGVPENAPFYADSDGVIYYTSVTEISKNTTEYIPVSKPNNQVWNFISQNNALINSENMYLESVSVTSQLIDGYAWDTVTNWIERNGHDILYSGEWGNFYDETFSVNGLYVLHVTKESGAAEIAKYYNWGTYTKNESGYFETATGIAERNKANNIYDFAGNFFELTTEVGNHDGTDITYAVRRGGGFDSSVVHATATVRLGSLSINSPGLAAGFRVVLYLK